MNNQPSSTAESPAICGWIKNRMLAAVMVMAIAPCASAASSPTNLTAQLGAACVEAKGDLLQVTSGRVARTWKWTGHGLVTTSYKDESSGREWAVPSQEQACD